MRSWIDAPLNSSQGLGNEPSNDSNRKKVKRRVCNSFGLGIRMKWHLHEHLMNKLFWPHWQVKQCKWLVKKEPIFNHGLALDSLHSHDPDLGGGHHPPLYNIFWTLPWGLHLDGKNAWDSQNCQVMILMTLWVYNFFIWTLIKEFPIKVAAFWQALSYVMLHVSIRVCLTHVS
jgi:hypothetical protein